MKEVIPKRKCVKCGKVEVSYRTVENYVCVKCKKKEGLIHKSPLSKIFKKSVRERLTSEEKK
jgi:predicted RNA-binding protein YlxR (DUF448 family)